MKLLIVCVVVLAAVSANPANISNENTVHNNTSANRNQLEEGFLRKLNTKCSQRDNHSCMMLKLIVYMNRIFKKSSIEINENLKVTQTRDPEIMTSNDEIDDDLYLARSLQSDNEALGVLVADKLWKFIHSRQLRYQITENADIILNTEPKGNLNFGLSISPGVAVEEGRARLRNLAPFVAMIATKVGIIGALIFKGLILLTGKALIVSKIALLLSVVIALKKLLSKKHVTYEVVAHPHHHEPTHSHDTYSSGWARALDGFLDGVDENIPGKILDAHDLAFNGQKPLQEI